MDEDQGCEAATSPQFVLWANFRGKSIYAGAHLCPSWKKGTIFAFFFQVFLKLWNLELVVGICGDESGINPLNVNELNRMIKNSQLLKQSINVVHTSALHPNIYLFTDLGLRHLQVLTGEQRRNRSKYKISNILKIFYFQTHHNMTAGWWK